MLNQTKITPKSPDSILTVKESHALALDHTKVEIKDQVAYWREQTAQDERDEDDGACYSKARIAIYLDLLAFIAEKY